MSFFKKSPGAGMINNDFPLMWSAYPARADKAFRVLGEIQKWIVLNDRSMESKHWQVLQDYCAEMIDELTKVSALDLKTGKSVYVYPHELDNS